MAHETLTLQFTQNINVSAQVGDIGYFVQVNNNTIDNIDFDANYTTPNTAPIQKIGEIIAINVMSPIQTNVVFSIHTWANVPDGINVSAGNPAQLDNYFIMFAKDNSVNLSNILGYYAKARFTNNHPRKAELFSVGSEIQKSSK